MSDQNSPQAPPEANETKAILKKIEHIESLKKQQGLFRTLSLVAVVALFAILFARLNGVKNDLIANQDVILQTIQADATETFKSRLTDLKSKAQNDLWPKLQETLKDEYKANEPLLEKHIKELNEEVKVITERRIRTMVESILDHAIQEMRGNLTEADLANAKENAVLLADMVTEKLMANSAETIIDLEPKFDALADKLTTISVNTVDQNTDHDQAERQLLASILDLLKYEVLPEEGLAPANSKKQ
jgi:hypothetical protein